MTSTIFAANVRENSRAGEQRAPLFWTLGPNQVGKGAIVGWRDVLAPAFAQYCGTQHAKMLLRVYVDSPEDFNAWVRGQQQPTTQDEKEAAGRHVFETTACVNCHAVGGTNGTGRFGPDLTHLMSRRTIAAGAAENTPENLRLWIQNPDAIKSGSLMPAMKLSDAELGALVRYLETLQ